MTLRITAPRNSGSAAEPERHRRAEARAAFTLVELLLVLALLAIVLTFAAPSLANFFRGRSLDGEARRLLALTRGGQSRAVSEGIPMMLWLDTKEKKYGLEQQPGWDERDSRAVEFNLDKELKMEVVNTNVFSDKFSPLLQLQRGYMSEAQRRDLPQIKFLPDGSIDETSPQVLRILDRDGLSITVALATNRLNYEIRKPQRED